MAGAGRGNGEPHEIFNSQIGPHGRTTQYMLRHHREDVIERAVQHLSDSCSLKLPAMLQRQQVRGERQQMEAQQEARSVLAILMKRGLSNAEVMLSQGIAFCLHLDNQILCLISGIACVHAAPHLEHALVMLQRILVGWQLAACSHLQRYTLFPGKLGAEEAH